MFIVCFSLGYHCQTMINYDSSDNIYFVYVMLNTKKIWLLECQCLFFFNCLLLLLLKKTFNLQPTFVNCVIGVRKPHGDRIHCKNVSFYGLCKYFCTLIKNTHCVCIDMFYTWSYLNRACHYCLCHFVLSVMQRASRGIRWAISFVLIIWGH